MKKLVLIVLILLIMPTILAENRPDYLNCITEELISDCSGVSFEELREHIQKLDQEILEENAGNLMYVGSTNLACGDKTLSYDTGRYIWGGIDINCPTTRVTQYITNNWFLNFFTNIYVSITITIAFTISIIFNIVQFIKSKKKK